MPVIPEDRRRTYWEVLGLKPGSSFDEIRKQYKRLALKVHQDKPGGSKEQFQQLSEAYEFFKAEFGSCHWTDETLKRKAEDLLAELREIIQKLQEVIDDRTGDDAYEACMALRAANEARQKKREEAINRRRGEQQKQRALDEHDLGIEATVAAYITANYELPKDGATTKTKTTHQHRGQAEAGEQGQAGGGTRGSGNSSAPSPSAAALAFIVAYILYSVAIVSRGMCFGE
ncbi:unnamed protein product [Vitrella brassicaformis CCMP3155]|uniref:J domain-containing protein n=1 Tax=Vitrella brassicaformis (strain CCMP3155) TaxID=1169540 RepID=A0A0G4H5W6_VITBC|nr:unnamed protein product [Vitrella brassicaformis CCMP3155]|eukprot:CEM39237.1 unnamed protein product [Vitrella brassicaformis CCMP3155]